MRVCRVLVQIRVTNFSTVIELNLGLNGYNDRFAGEFRYTTNVPTAQANHYWSKEFDNGPTIDIVLTRTGVTAEMVRYELDLMLRGKKLRIICDNYRASEPSINLEHSSLRSQEPNLAMDRMASSNRS